MSSEKYAYPAFRLREKLGMPEFKMAVDNAYVVEAAEGVILSCARMGSRERHMMLPQGSVLIRDTEGFSLAIPGIHEYQDFSPFEASTASLRLNNPHPGAVGVLIPTDLR